MRSMHRHVATLVLLTMLALPTPSDAQEAAAAQPDEVPRVATAGRALSPTKSSKTSALLHSKHQLDEKMAGILRKVGAKVRDSIHRFSRMRPTHSDAQEVRAGKRLLQEGFIEEICSASAEMSATELAQAIELPESLALDLLRCFCSDDFDRDAYYGEESATDFYCASNDACMNWAAGIYDYELAIEAEHVRGAPSALDFQPSGYVNEFMECWCDSPSTFESMFLLEMPSPELMCSASSACIKAYAGRIVPRMSYAFREPRVGYFGAYDACSCEDSEDSDLFLLGENMESPDDPRWTDTYNAACGSRQCRTYMEGFGDSGTTCEQVFHCGIEGSGANFANFFFGEEGYGNYDCSKISGDPHFRIAHGDTFDFRGRDRVTYALMSTANMQLNALFQNTDYHDAGSKHRLVHGSFMTAGYVRVRADDGREIAIEYNSRLAVFLAVGIEANEPTPYREPVSLSIGNVTISLVNRIAKVVTNEWQVTLSSKMKRGIINATSCAEGQCFLEVHVTPLTDADHAKVTPHGLLGQAWDGDDVGVIGAVDEYKGKEITTKAMGEGAIEGEAKDYEVASKFSTSFKFSRWGLEAAKPRNVSSLAGKKVPRIQMRGAATATEKKS